MQERQLIGWAKREVPGAPDSIRIVIIFCIALFGLTACVCLPDVAADRYDLSTIPNDFITQTFFATSHLDAQKKMQIQAYEKASAFDFDLSRIRREYESAQAVCSRPDDIQLRCEASRNFKLLHFNRCGIPGGKNWGMLRETAVSIQHIVFTYQFVGGGKPSVELKIQYE